MCISFTAIYLHKDSEIISKPIIFSYPKKINMVYAYEVSAFSLYLPNLNKSLGITDASPRNI